MAGSGIRFDVERTTRPNEGESIAREAARDKRRRILVVGGDDTEVLALNEGAYAHLKCEKSLFVVPGATHLFEEPGTLEIAARHASDWFTRHLAPALAEK